jgi:hypothetical protein
MREFMNGPRGIQTSINQSETQTPGEYFGGWVNPNDIDPIDDTLTTPEGTAPAGEGLDTTAVTNGH